MSETNVEEVAVDTSVDAEQGGAPEIETKARDMGWVPQEEWKGDPEQWRDADEFVRRGEEILPILRSTNKRLQDRIDRLESENGSLKSDFDKRIKGLERTTQVALKRQREQIESEFEAKKLRAVELGDTDGYTAAAQAEKKALADLNDKADDAAEDEGNTGQNVSPEIKKSLSEWIGANPWYSSSPRLRGAADEHFEDVKAEMPGLSFAEQLDEVRKRVAAEYPEKFGGKRPASNAVEGGSRIPGGGGAQRMATRLPAEAKSAGEKFVADGLFKDMEDYAKSYFAQEAS